MISLQRKRLQPWQVFLLLGSLLLLSGCRPPQVDTTYGKRQSGQGGGSVNGTAVFAEMFRARGARLRSATRLTPKLERADVIVWVPDDFAPPTQEQRDYLEDWLYEGERTLIYVGRDFNAAPLYWQRVAREAPLDQKQELLRRYALSRSEHEEARASMDDQLDGDWFTVDVGERPTPVKKLEGPWASEIDPQQADLHLRGTLVPTADIVPGNANGWYSARESEVLLASQGNPLIYRITSEDYYDSQILVVANGSALFNLPLVNQENRKLAGKLVEASMPADEVVFLETLPGGPDVLSSDPGGKVRSGWEAFTIYPLGVILMHLAVAGTLYCFARFAIFGRPRSLPTTRLSDFGHHIAALGKLLEHTGDIHFARQRLRHYNQTARRDSGASHVKPKKSGQSTN